MKTGRRVMEKKKNIRMKHFFEGKYDTWSGDFNNTG